MQTGRPCSVQQRGAPPRLAAEARRPLDDVKRVSQLSSKWIEAKSRGDKCVTQAGPGLRGGCRGCGGRAREDASSGTAGPAPGRAGPRGPRAGRARRAAVLYIAATAGGARLARNNAAHAAYLPMPTAASIITHPYLYNTPNCVSLLYSLGARSRTRRRSCRRASAPRVVAGVGEHPECAPIRARCRRPPAAPQGGPLTLAQSPVA